MRTASRVIFFVIALCVGVATATAQYTLSGMVTAPDGKPLAGAIVEVSDDDQSVAFGNSRQDGIYSLTIPKEYARQALTISFRKLNHENQLHVLSPGATSFSTVMYPGSETLREVIVKPTPVMQVGDTLRFFMGAFATASDFTLEDGLKRIPGISVSESGAISYMGRDISQFYIEGLDLLGGRYNLATRNIPIDKVTNVEVLRHHRHNKVDKNELSSNVALNIRLTEKAKIKPFGTYELRAGLDADHTPLYGGSGTAMLFRKDFQMLGTLKLSNDGRMGVDELNSHFGQTSWNTGAENVLPLLSGSRPPFMPHRYEDRRNETASINALQKISEDNQLKANVDYTHENTGYGYGIYTSYPLGDSIAVTDECLHFMQKSHKVTADMEYRSNKAHRLFENKLSLYGRFADAEGIAMQGIEQYNQLQRRHVVGVRNALVYVRNVGDWKLRFNSDMQYTGTPEGTLDIRLNQTSIARQTAYSTAFKMHDKFYTGYTLPMGISVGLPVTFTLNVGNLTTELQGADVKNAISGWDMSCSIAPNFDFQTDDRKLRLYLDVPFKLLTNDYQDLLTGRKMDFNKAFVDASLYVHYVPNGKSDIEGRSDWWHTYGDYLSLLSAPIQTDYRTQQLRSGIFGNNRTSRTRIAYEWQSPMEFWCFNSSVSYTYRVSNVMRGQTLDGSHLSLSEHLADNTSDNIHIDGKLSKYLLSFKTSLLVGGHYAWSHSQMHTMGSPVLISTNDYEYYCEVRSNPITQFDATYRASISHTLQRTYDNTNHYADFSQRLQLTYLPIAAFNLHSSAEWKRTTLTDGNNRYSLLIDAGAEYHLKKKKVRLRLDANNLLNMRNYHYTLYRGLNTYRYDYLLRGRELLFSVILT